MYNKIVSLVATISLIVFSAGLVVIPANPAFAATTDDAKQAVCAGANISANGGGGCSTTNQIDLAHILTVALNLLSIVAAAAAVIMIMIAGIKFITSQGDPAAITSARNTLLYSIIGLVVLALSQFIVKFVVNKLK